MFLTTKLMQDFLLRNAASILKPHSKMVCLQLGNKPCLHVCVKSVHQSLSQQVLNKETSCFYGTKDFDAL